ncbi:MAG: hypothetical protein GWM90_28270 [Gemmatimonadetes bacterium]|nr:hypothetical protein [Gemmatimonadota bacterium]NIQ58924.1 hypothetical protein [Gemmatimonadota bacterium]NIU79109.1 hypothetical protein [Gammaproteobacteria bacterium]NIX47824.1 hypothetical protein [Gemmatimonadota bacterium]NIY12183.1 hypothetical protein [Gemmatimonadota bacterium]
MNRVSPVVAVLCLGALVGCDADAARSLLEPPNESRRILDARDAEFAGSGVFLLPPIYDGSTVVRTGDFDLSADPRVEICELDVAGELNEDNIEAASCLEPLVAWFETDAAHDGSTFIQVTPGPGEPATVDSMFSVGWNTSAGDAGKAFRVTVLMPDLVYDPASGLAVEYETAAYFDAILEDNSSTKLDPDRVVGYTAGKNFPIKLIVEVGAGCDGLDCFAFEVTCLGGTFRTPHAGASFPLDWAPQCSTAEPVPTEEERWLFVQEKLPEGAPCVTLPSDGVDGIPFEPCYVWQLVKEVDTGDATQFVFYTEEFAQAVKVQFCADDVPEAFLPLTGIFRRSSLPGGGYETALVPESATPAFEDQLCPSPDASATGFGLSALLDGVVRPALRLVGIEPSSLYAGDGGTLTGNTKRTSHFQRILQLIVTAADSYFAGLAGGTVPLEVAVTSPSHHDDGASAEPIAGVTVEFRSDDFALVCVDGAGGSVPCQATTDENGLAEINAVLPTSPGTYTIYAVVIYDGREIGRADWAGDALAFYPTFLEPLDEGKAAQTDELFAPTVYICEEAARPCDAGSALMAFSPQDLRLVQETGRKFYQTIDSWKPRDTKTPLGTTVYVQVLLQGTTIGYSDPIEVTKGGKIERIDDRIYNGENASLTVKFIINRVGS